MQYLQLASNYLDLNGNIFGDLTDLRVLNVRNNRLYGTVSWTSNLVHLECLDLRNNSFNGPLVGIDQLPNLEFLGIGGSGLQVNISAVRKLLPRLTFYDDHFRTNNIACKDWLK